MDTKRATWMIGVVGTLVLGGCTKATTSSANIKTPGIVATIEVEASSDTSSTVKVSLTVGDASGTTVTLDSGDSLSASANGDSKQMTSESAGEYIAKFGTGAADTEFVVDLQRPNDTPAPDSRGTLPAPFTIGKLAASSRADDDLTITWDPSGTGDEVNLHLDNPDCIFFEDKDVPDTGSYTFEKGTIKNTDDNKPETCDVTVKIERSRHGSHDSNYDTDSTFLLKQVRSSKFTSTP